MKIALTIFAYSLPLLAMIGLIPFIHDGALLTALFILPALLYFIKNPTKKNYLVYTVGLVAMTLSESIFLTTGVERFRDETLFGIMPLWLPFLWAYGFLVIKDSLLLIEKA